MIRMGIWESDTEAYCKNCNKETDCKYYNFDDEMTGTYCLECEGKIDE